MESTVIMAAVVGVLIGFGIMAIVTTIQNVAERRANDRRRLGIYE